jgi:hypothetical protein
VVSSGGERHRLDAGRVEEGAAARRPDGLGARAGNHLVLTNTAFVRPLARKPVNTFLLALRNNLSNCPVAWRSGHRHRPRNRRTGIESLQDYCFLLLC